MIDPDKYVHNWEYELGFYIVVDIFANRVI